MRELVALIVGALLGGCTPSVPSHQWRGEQAATATLAQRGGSIRSVRATATITLTSVNNQHVTLDAAIVADNAPATSAQEASDSPPDRPKSAPNALRLRIRTWKFGQAIFDLTARPDGTWLAADSQGDAPPDKRLESLKPEQIAQAWNLFFGDFFSRPGLRTSTDPRSRTLLAVRDEDGVTTECRLDMDTLTAREYVISDDHGRVRQTLTLARYQPLGDPPTPWPMLVIARGDQGRVMVRFDEVEINPALEDSVFTPPRRAVKQP
jgi:hypothetical protein